MLDTLRTFFRRFTASSPSHAVRQRLFREQNRLAQDLRRSMRAYERKIEALQSRLLHLKDDEIASADHLFEDAHRALERTLARLQATDQEAETLVREWRDWLDHHDPATLSREAKERLEILRSELALRGLLPKTASERPAATPPVKPKRRVNAYRPAVLSDDPLSAFDAVFLPRVHGELAWIEGHWHAAQAVQARPAWLVWLTRRRKRAHAWKKRLKNIVT